MEKAISMAEKNLRRRTSPVAADGDRCLHVCRVCGWCYDLLDYGDLEFERLPSSWTCPICGVSKREFEGAARGSGGMRPVVHGHVA